MTVSGRNFTFFDGTPSFKSEDECVEYMRTFVEYARAGDIDPIKFYKEMEFVAEVLEFIDETYFTEDDWRVLFPYVYHPHRDVTESVSVAFHAMFTHFSTNLLKDFVINCFDKSIVHPDDICVSTVLNSLNVLIKRNASSFVEPIVIKHFDKLIELHLTAFNHHVVGDSADLLRHLFRWCPEYINKFTETIMGVSTDSKGVTMLIRVMEFVGSLHKKQILIFALRRDFREIPCKVVEKIMSSDDVLGKHVIINYLNKEMISTLTKVKMETIYPDGNVYVIIKNRIEEFKDDVILYKDIVYLLCGATRHGGVDMLKRLDTFNLCFSAYERKFIFSYTELVSFLLHCMVNWRVIVYVFDAENVEIYNKICVMVRDTILKVHYSEQSEFIVNLMSFFRILAFYDEFSHYQPILAGFQKKFFCEVMKPIFFNFLYIVFCKAEKDYQSYGMKLLENVLLYPWSIEHILQDGTFMKVLKEGDLVIDPFNDVLLTDIISSILKREEYAQVFTNEEQQFLWMVACEGGNKPASVAEPQTLRL